MAKSGRKRTLTDSQLEDMKERFISGETKTAIARKHGVDITTVISYLSYGSQSARTAATAYRKGFNSANEYIKHQRAEKRRVLSEISRFLISHHKLK